MGRIIIVDIHLQSITAEKFFDQNVKLSASQNASTRGPPTHSYHPYLRIVSITMFYRPHSIFSAIDPLLSCAKIVVPKPRRRTRSYFRHWRMERTLPIRSCSSGAKYDIGSGTRASVSESGSSLYGVRDI